MAEHTGRDYEQLAHDTDRDNFLNAQESVDYGLIDHIMTSRLDATSGK